MDISISPDLDARVCYGIVFLCAVWSARRQVGKLFEIGKTPASMAWGTNVTWVPFLGYSLIPLGLFWLMDRMGAVSDTSLFSALLIGLAYSAVVEGGLGGIKVPAGLDGILKFLTMSQDTIIIKANMEWARLGKRFEDYIVGRMLRDREAFDEILLLVFSTAHDPEKLEAELSALTSTNIPDAEVLREKKARWIALRLSFTPDSIEKLSGKSGWREVRKYSPAYRAAKLGTSAWIVLIVALLVAGWVMCIPRVGLRYHVWRLGKPIDSLPDRNRSQERLKGVLMDTNLGPVAFQSLARGLRSSSLPVERVDSFLQLLLQARHQSYYDESLCCHLLDTLRGESVELRKRVHQALLFLARKREEKFDETHKDLATWTPGTSDAIENLEEKVDQWEVFFCRKAAPAK